MRVVVTGGGGFLGSHLVTELRSAGHDPVALTSPRAPDGLTVELTNAGEVLAVLGRYQPDAVIHLAARAKPASIDGIRDLMTNNVQAALNVFEGVRQIVPRARVIVGSSSAVYGRVPRERNPIREDEAPHPALPYGASKAAVEALANVYFAHGLDMVVVRPFNLIGPGQSAAFAISRFAQQIAAVRAGSLDPIIRTGPLDTVRDFLDVRDAAKGYALLLQTDSSGGVFNLCSGIPRLLRDVLTQLIDAANVSAEIHEEAGLSSGGRADVPYQAGSHVLLSVATGWQPKVEWMKTLADILDYWRTVNRVGTA